MPTELASNPPEYVHARSILDLTAMDRGDLMQDSGDQAKNPRSTGHWSVHTWHCAAPIVIENSEYTLLTMQSAKYTCLCTVQPARGSSQAYISLYVVAEESRRSRGAVVE